MRRESAERHCRARAASAAASAAAMDADYRRTSARLRREIAAEGGMQWDQRPEDMVDWEAEARMGWCRRMWRGKWNLKPRGPLWLPEIIRLTW